MARKTKTQEKEAEPTAATETKVEEQPKPETEPKKEKEVPKEKKPEPTEDKKSTVSEASDDSKDDKSKEDSSTESAQAESFPTPQSTQPSTIEKPPSSTANNYPNTLIDSTLKFFVGGLHPNTDEAQLSAYFSKYGQILSTQVMRDAMTGRHRGFGFVTLKVQPNSMSVFKDNHTVSGKRIDVRAMQTDVAAGLRKKIFVGGLSKALNEEMLEEYFSKFGEVDKVTIMRQLDGSSRGFGFIVFTTDEAASGALKNPTHFVYGNKVDVRAAETRPKVVSQPPVNTVYPYAMMHPPTTEMYSQASPMYRPGASYDPNQYANLTQQQMLQQQYPQYQLLQQQMVQQMAMAGTYGSYYAQGQPSPTTSGTTSNMPTTNPYTAPSGKKPESNKTLVTYGAYRGKNDSSYTQGSSNEGSRGSYRQQPY